MAIDLSDATSTESARFCYADSLTLPGNWDFVRGPFAALPTPTKPSALKLLERALFADARNIPQEGKGLPLFILREKGVDQVVFDPQVDGYRTHVIDLDKNWDAEKKGVVQWTLQ